VNLDDVREILALMRENGLSEFEIEHEGLRLRLRKDTAAAAAPPLTAGSAPSVAAAAAHALAASGLDSTAGAPAPGQTEGQGTAGSPGLQATEAEIELAVVKSPIVGTFYRSSEPAAAAFVEIGARVKKGQVLCIIEAMKLMNEIDSEYDGEIVNVYVENGQPVQYGERLFAIRTT
jgi:acetyl-CoA carboxylase biotin carboxyl carrier protein